MRKLLKYTLERASQETDDLFLCALWMDLACLVLDGEIDKADSLIDNHPELQSKYCYEYIADWALESSETNP